MSRSVISRCFVSSHHDGGSQRETCGAVDCAECSMGALKHRPPKCGVAPPGMIPSDANRLNNYASLRRRARTTRPPSPDPSIARPAHSAGSGTADGDKLETVRLPIPGVEAEIFMLPTVVDNTSLESPSIAVNIAYVPGVWNDENVNDGSNE